MRLATLGLILLLPLALQPSPESAAATPAAPSVRLLEAGEAPRARLRHAVSGGSSESISIEATGSASLAGAAKEPIALEDIAFRAKVVATLGLGSEGRLPATLRLDEVRFSAKGREPDAGRIPWAGRSLTAVLDPRGRLLSANLEDEEDPSVPVLFDALRPVALPLMPALPDEAVGKGARWETETRLPIPGLTATQKTVFELREREESGALVLAVRVSHVVSPGPLRSPRIPKGVLVTLGKVEAGGEGTLKLRPGRAVGSLSLRYEAKGTAALLTPAGAATAEATLALEIRAGPGD